MLWVGSVRDRTGGGGVAAVSARAAGRLNVDVVESGRGRGSGRVHGGNSGRLVCTAEPLAGRRIVTLRARRIRGGVVKKAQVERVRGAGAERHVGRQFVGRRRAAQARRQRLVELEHIHVTKYSIVSQQSGAVVIHGGDSEGCATGRCLRDKGQGQGARQVTDHMASSRPVAAPRRPRVCASLPPPPLRRSRRPNPFGTRGGQTHRVARRPRIYGTKPSRIARLPATAVAVTRAGRTEHTKN